MSMTDIGAILTTTPAAPGSFRAQVPDGWQQGRGAFGGLVIGLLARAGTAAAGDPSRGLRSLTAELCGPTQPGPADISVEALRAGSGVTTLAARLVQGSEVQAHATLVLGRTREPAETWDELERPAAPPWREVPVVALPGAPVFTRHLEYRPTRAPAFTGGEASVAEGWVRFPRAPATVDAAYVAMLIDAWWPAAFARMRAPRPMATIAFTLQLVADPARIDPSEPVFHRARTPVAAGGYMVEFRELWSPAGELLALNQQTFVVIR